MNCGGREGEIIVWDVASGSLLEQQILGNTVGSMIELRADGQWAIYGVDESIILWDVINNGEIDRFPPGLVNNVAFASAIFTPDGETIFLASEAGSIIRLHPTEKQEE